MGSHLMDATELPQPLMACVHEFLGKVLNPLDVGVQKMGKDYAYAANS